MPNADLGDISLNYSTHGQGQAVLGIMGFSLDKRFWSAQIPAVTATHRFVVFDNRGVGRSTGGAPTSIDQMADDAVRLLDHLEIEKAVVFGMSMGGTIAQRLILDHPDRVSAAILAVTWARPIEFMLRQHDAARVVIDALGPRALVDHAMLRMFTPRFFEVGAELLDQMIASLDRPGAPELTSAATLKGQLDSMDKHDVLHELSSISIPTLVLGGKMDVTVPGFASEEIAQAIPGARLEMFETGHGCMIEEMDRFNQVVSGFLRSL